MWFQQTFTFTNCVYINVHAVADKPVRYLWPTHTIQYTCCIKSFYVFFLLLLLFLFRFFALMNSSKCGHNNRNSVYSMMITNKSHIYMKLCRTFTLFTFTILIITHLNVFCLLCSSFFFIDCTLCCILSHSLQCWSVSSSFLFSVGVRMRTRDFKSIV